MSTTVMVSAMAEASPRNKARLAGLFWLLTAVFGTVAMAGDKLVVYRDAAATAANILANQGLYRLTFTANLVAACCYLVATVLVYALLAPVNRNVSLLAALFSVTGCAVSAAGFIFRIAPLVILTGQSPHLDDLALTFLRLNAQGFYIGHVFFGLHCFLVGALLLRSTLLPRAIGVLMTLAGLGWLTMSLSSLLAPQFARSLFPFVMMPGVLGELSLSLWLVIFGAKGAR